MLVSVAQVRAGCPKASPGDDTLLETLILGVGAAFARFCGYGAYTASGSTPTMESATYVLELRGNGSRELDLRVSPVTAVTLVELDTTLDYDGAEQTVASTEYALVRERWLRLRSSASVAWPTLEGAVRVTCTAGLSSVPEDLEQLAIAAIVNWYNLRDTQGKASAGSPGASTSYRDEAFLPPWVVGPLGHYVLPSAVA